MYNKFDPTYGILIYHLHSYEDDPFGLASWDSVMSVSVLDPQMLVEHRCIEPGGSGQGQRVTYLSEATNFLSV